MRMRVLGIEEVLITPKSSWQNPYSKRVTGSIRRECLDNTIALNKRHLKRTHTSYFDYVHRWRTHLSLATQLWLNFRDMTILETKPGEF